MADATTGAAGSRYQLPLKIYNDFRGGINVDMAPDTMPENCVVQADNVIISDFGGFKRRPGEAYLNSTSYEAQVEQLIQYTKNDGTDLLMAIIGTNLCTVDQSTGTSTVITDTGTTKIAAEFHNDSMLYCNGSGYKSFDGTNLGNVKLTAPTVAPTVTKYRVPVATGSDGGDLYYQYMVTFVAPGEEDNEEGLEFRASAEFIGSTSNEIGTDSISLTDIPVGEIGAVAKRKIYRHPYDTLYEEIKRVDYTIGYYLVDTLNDNTTTTCTDSKSPEVVATSAALDEAAITGTYKICYTFVTDAGYESSPSPTTEFTIDSGNYNYAFKMTIPISSDTSVTQRNIYRSISGEDTMKLVGSIYDNTTTTFYDSLEDEDNVGDAVVEDDDNNVEIVETCTMLVRHLKSNRFFAAGNTDDQAALYFSEINRPDYFPVDNILYPTYGDGPITALAVFGDAVFAFYEASIWMFRGIDPTEDAAWEKVPTGLGCVSQWSIINTPNSLSWLGHGGFYVMNPSVVGYGGEVLETDEFLIKNIAAEKITSDIAELNTPSICTGVYDSVNGRALWACTDSEGVRNNIIYCSQWDIQAFTTWSGTNVNHFLRLRDGTILAAINNYILTMNTGYNHADGTAITATVKSKPYHLGLLFNRKRFTRLYTEFKYPDEGGITISFKVYVDDRIVYEADHVSTASGFIWGESVWGEARWGGKSLITTRNRLFANGHRIVIEFTCDQLDVECHVYAWGVEYRRLKAKGESI